MKDYNFNRQVIVNSSLVGAVGYDPTSKALLVDFISTGESYVFKNVSDEDYQTLVNARSVGSTFNTVIKPKYDDYEII